MRVAQDSCLPHCRGRSWLERLLSMSGSSHERTGESADPIDLDRLAVDSDYRRDVMLRLKAEAQGANAEHPASRARTRSNSRRD
jgi:hypothetical protein